jgi:hypothetical protein
MFYKKFKYLCGDKLINRYLCFLGEIYVLLLALLSEVQNHTLLFLTIY